VPVSAQRTSFESVPSGPVSRSDSLVVGSESRSASRSAGRHSGRPRKKRDAPREVRFEGTARFEVVGRLGRGGMSVVHAVLDHRSGKRLALKVLRDPAPERLSVLKKEFRRVAGVVHPNLVHMHELFDGPDGTFFTMELIEGRRLWSWVREPHFAALNLAPTSRPRGYDQPPRPLRSPGAWARLLDVARQLATALFALHSREILHQDVKPSNALVRPDGTVVVLDFGLSRDLHDRRVNPSGRVAGTLAYMAPEQLRLRAPGPAADWYALGSTLFELATGTLPFAGEEEDVYTAKIERTQPRRLTEIADEAPADFGALIDALLDPDAAKRPTADHVLATLGLRAGIGQETMPELQRVKQPPVGRAAAMSFLEGGVREALSFGRSLRELRGVSGIGKSTVARWFCSRARANGAVVFRGACYERESVPFKAFDRLIDRLVDRIARRGEAGRAAVVPHRRRALVRLFPAFRRLAEFASDDPPGLDPRTVDSAAIRRDAFAALGSLLSRYAAGRLIVISLDDVQWADRDSAALAAHLLAAPESPIMVLLCRRPEGDAPDLQALAGDIPLPAARVHHLGRLEDADAAKLARRVLGPEHASEELVTSVVRESDGSPFWLEQLGLFSRAPVHMGPHGEGVPAATPLQGMLRAAIDTCPDEARDLLTMLSVAGRPIDRPLAEELAAGPVLKSADRLAEAGLVIVTRVDDGAALEVRHGRVADAALDRLSTVQRRAAHARLAEGLLTTDGDAAEVSVHLFAAGVPQRAAGYALAGARAACDVLAFGRAARLLQIALEHEQDAARTTDLLVELGDVLANDSRGAEAADAFLRAADRVDGPRALDLRHRAAEQLMRSGRVDEGRELLEELLEGQGLRIRRTPALALLNLLWGRAKLRLRGTEFTPRPESDVPPEVLSRIDSAWSAAVTLGLVDAVSAAAFQVQGLLLALEVGEPLRVARAFGAEAVFHSVFGNRDPAEALLARYEEIVEELDDAGERAGLALARSVAAYQRGDWGECHGFARRCLKHLSGLRANLSWTRSTAVVYRLAAAGHLGRLDEIVRVLPRELAHARARGDLHALLHLSLGMPVALDAILDRPEAGIRQARSVWADSPGRHYAQLQIHALRTEAELALVARDVETAERAGRRGWELATGADTRRIVVVRLSACELALRCELCGGTDGIDRPRRKRIGRLIRHLRGSGAPWADAAANLAEAQVWALDQESSAALGGFDRAIAQFSELDMRLYAEAARYGRGCLLGGEAGRIDRTRAVEWAERTGAVAPLRLFRMIAPAVHGLSRPRR